MKLFYSTLTASLILTTGIAAAYAANDAPPPPAESKLNSDTAQKKRDSSVPSGDNTDVTIIRKKDAVIEEVRVNGKLRYAKITPKKGKPYYMYDSDGDGVLDATEDDLQKADVNQWILMEW